MRTLPTLLAKAENDERAARLRVIVEGSPVTDPAEALELVRGSAGTRKARAMAGMYGERARAALARLPDGQARQELADLCDLVTVREE